VSDSSRVLRVVFLRVMVPLPKGVFHPPFKLAFPFPLILIEISTCSVPEQRRFSEASRFLEISFFRPPGESTHAESDLSSPFRIFSLSSRRSLTLQFRLGIFMMAHFEESPPPPSAVERFVPVPTPPPGRSLILSLSKIP